MKIVTIVGARPQFIKAAVISRVLQELNSRSIKAPQEIIVHTGQHYDDCMSDIFFREMQIPSPVYQLGIGGTNHGAMTGQMIEKLELLLLKEKPALVLVYGDTNSTLAGAIAAAKLLIPIAHVEAGLRSFNTKMPEEINRILTDRISRWLFCPTMKAVQNLEMEGATNWPNAQVYNVGDVMYDAALFYRKQATARRHLADLLERYHDNFYLATVHRQENTDNQCCLKSIWKALEEIARRVPLILPLHPRTRKYLKEAGLKAQWITVIEPVSYLEMMSLLNGCKAVFTDSGGLQKEAYFFHKPCITLREETEWTELVEHGYNCLVGSDAEGIISAEQKLFSQDRDYSTLLYGDGRAGEKIVKILIDALN